MQWQDWRSGGRELSSAPRRYTRAGVRVRFVAGGEQKGQGCGHVDCDDEAEGCAAATRGGG
eukprot:6532410-Prymnesium_polylepis.1